MKVKLLAITLLLFVIIGMVSAHSGHIEHDMDTGSEIGSDDVTCIEHMEHNDMHTGHCMKDENKVDASTNVESVTMPPYTKLVKRLTQCVEPAEKTQLKEYLEKKGVDVIEVEIEPLDVVVIAKCGAPSAYLAKVVVPLSEVRLLKSMGWQLEDEKEVFDNQTSNQTGDDNLNESENQSEARNFRYMLRVFAETEKGTRPVRADVWLLENDTIVKKGYGHVVPIRYDKSGVKALVGVIGFSVAEVELNERGIYVITFSQNGVSVEVKPFEEMKEEVKEKIKDHRKEIEEKIREMLERRKEKIKEIKEIIVENKGNKKFYKVKVKKPLQIFGLELPLDVEEEVEIEESELNAENQ